MVCVQYNDVPYTADGVAFLYNIYLIYSFLQPAPCLGWSSQISQLTIKIGFHEVFVVFGLELLCEI